jgi:hypothetical protein
MTHDVWRPLTWKDPKFTKFASRYTDERRKDIACLAEVEADRRDLFLTRVLTLAYTLLMEIQELGRTITPKQRSDLKALSNILKDAKKRARNLEVPAFEAITIQARIEAASALDARWDLPIDWVDSEGEVHFRSPGHPTDPEESQAWAKTGIGRFLISGDDQGVQNAIGHLVALARWTSVAAKSNPKNKRGRPHEVVVRRAIRRLLRVWEKASTNPATSRGAFSRFVDAVLRPALQGYWPDQRGFETAIDDVLEGEKQRRNGN